jgi:WD40 repeat protein
MKAIFRLVPLLLALLFSYRAHGQAPTVRAIPVQDSPGLGMELSPDGRFLAIYENPVVRMNEPDSEYLPIRLIDVETGEEIGRLEGQTDYAGDVAFTPDSSQIATQHTNGEIYLWDVASQEPIKRMTTWFLGTGRIKFLGDGKTLVYFVGGLRAGFLFIDLETGAIRRTVTHHFETFQDYMENYTTYPALGEITYSAFDVTVDGNWIVAATANDGIVMFDTTTGKETVLRPGGERFAQFNIRNLWFTPDESQFGFFDMGTDQVRIWDVATGSEVSAVEVGDGIAAVFGNQVAWLTREDAAAYIAPLDQTDSPTTLVELPETLDVAPGISSLIFSEDGTTLIAGGFNADDGENMIYVIELGG